MLDIYRSLAKGKGALANLHRIIISSGDVDPVVNMRGTEEAAKRLGFPVTKGGDRRPWFFNMTAAPLDFLAHKPISFGLSLHAQDASMQLGGFVTNYDTGAGENTPTLDFVQVRGSGHMVPQYAPQQALHVIQSSLLQSKLLSPPLPADWGTSSDDSFYGYGKKSSMFATWIKRAKQYDQAAQTREVMV